MGGYRQVTLVMLSFKLYFECFLFLLVGCNFVAAFTFALCESFVIIGLILSLDR